MLAADRKQKKKKKKRFRTLTREKEHYFVPKIGEREKKQNKNKINLG